MDYPHRSDRGAYHPALRIYTPLASFHPGNDDRSFHRLYDDLFHPDCGQPLFQGVRHALNLALESAAGGVALLKFLYWVFASGFVIDNRSFIYKMLENGVLDG